MVSSREAMGAVTVEMSGFKGRSRFTVDVGVDAAKLEVAARATVRRVKKVFIV